MVSIVPARPPEHNSLSPVANWMYVAREVISESLSDFSPPNNLRPEFSYFTKPIKYKDTETFQVFFGNWTLHWEMCLHGTEEYDEQERYGDLTERILISLDVEAGGRKVPRVGSLQRHVLQRVEPIASELLPECEPKLIEHHLVWEAVDFNPYDQESICEAAHRLAQYIKVLASPTVEAALQWAESGGFELQYMRPVAKAS